jgi:phosphoglycerate dehydrogenase-like enzyme
MAPGRIDSPVQVLSGKKAAKPTVYLLDDFHPTAIKHAQSLFNAILPGDERHSEWREKAEYLLIRGSYLTASDVQSSPKLKAIGKQGVGE